MSNTSLTKQDMTNLKQANKELREDFKNLPFPFFKVFHVSHQLANPVHHYQNYNKQKYNGLTLLIYSLDSKTYTVLFTHCLKVDTYNKALGSNYVLKNMLSLISKKANVFNCVNFEFNNTYTSINDKELVRQALFAIKSINKERNTKLPTYEDLTPIQIKEAIKNVSSQLEDENNKLVYSYTVKLKLNKFGYTIITTNTVTVSLVNRSTKEVILSATVKRNPKDKDNRQLGRVYALLALQKKLDKNKEVV